MFQRCSLLRQWKLQMGMSIKGYTLKIEGPGDSMASIDVHSMRKRWDKYASIACRKEKLLHVIL